MLRKIGITIIIVFILVNFILFGIYIVNSGTSRQVRASVMSSIGDTLSAANITITADKFPVLPATLPIYSATNALSDKTSIANAILGPSNYMLAPNQFENNNEDLIVNGGSFNYSPIGLDDNTLQKLIKPQTFFAELQAKSVLKQSNLWTSTSKFTATQNDANSKQTILTVSDMLGKYQVLDSYEKVWVGTDKTKDIRNRIIVTQINGYNWLNTTYKQEPDSDKRILSIAEVLTKFANSRTDSTPMTITEIDFGYLVGERAPDSKTVDTDIGLKIVTNQGVTFLSCLQ